MSFLKAQVSFPSNGVSVFTAIKHNSPILFLAQALYTLFKRSPLKCKFLRFSSAWVKICQIPYINFELTSHFLFKFCIILPCNNIKLLYTYLAQTLYVLFKRSPLKCKFLRFSSARVKICQIPHVNFELTSQFLFKFCIILHCHDTNFPCKF